MHGVCLCAHASAAAPCSKEYKHRPDRLLVYEVVPDEDNLHREEFAHGRPNHLKLHLWSNSFRKMFFYSRARLDKLLSREDIYGYCWRECYGDRFEELGDRLAERVVSYQTLEPDDLSLMADQVRVPPLAPLAR